MHLIRKTTFVQLHINAVLIFLGATGLTVKQQVEKRVGLLYPDMSTHRHKYKPLSLKHRGDERAQEKRTNRHTNQDMNRDSMQDPNQPSSSRDVSDIGQIENTPMDIQSDATGNTPDNSGVTNPNNSMATLYFNKSLAGNGMTFFKKSRLMHSWGFASNKFAIGPPGDKKNDYIAYNTSLAYIPVDWVPFYLSPAEHSSLPIGSVVSTHV